MINIMGQVLTNSNAMATGIKVIAEYKRALWAAIKNPKSSCHLIKWAGIFIDALRSLTMLNIKIKDNKPLLRNKKKW